MNHDALNRSLERIAAEMEAVARDPWWVIGSAALWLHGVDPGRVEDVDLLASPADGERLMHRWGLEHHADDHPQFRSECYGRWTAAEVPVELMAGFQLFEAGVWRAVLPNSREAIAVGNASLFTPSLEEQAALLRRFGREKDLDRLARIDAAKGQ
ncbi:hypothetical protein [Sphingomicrobium aestuariivivum]|uniref:hypothetical protein n=1 Tax=Sphingomicrobium aestuariivivum TaxID=1582356 RepID=UPI001FD6363F|nr:hypothetical protein [Sphingomicrobium aestuariivivum]MCJ8190249.1 hypothetical protein [Sphingomicrobium aestuariivivum]